MPEASQRRLAMLLRAAIDTAMRTNQPEPMARLARLLEENPINAGAYSVRYTLGIGRLKWLEAHGMKIENQSHPFKPDPKLVKAGRQPELITCECGLPADHPLHKGGKGMLLRGVATPEKLG